MIYFIYTFLTIFLLYISIYHIYIYIISLFFLLSDVIDSLPQEQYIDNGHAIHTNIGIPQELLQELSHEVGIQ